MAVVGFDDSEASRTGYPSLTTVRQDAALRAGIAVTSIEAMGRGQSCAERSYCRSHCCRGRAQEAYHVKIYKGTGQNCMPVTLQSMLQASFSIVDQIMIGQLGAVSIAAVGLGGNYSMIFNVVSGSVGTVAGILIAQFLGARG